MATLRLKNCSSIAIGVFLFGAVTGAQAELKELSDKNLSEQDAKSGITIDLEMQVTIGEFVWLDSDTPVPSVRQDNAISSPPKRYVIPVVVND